MLHAQLISRTRAAVSVQFVGLVPGERDLLPYALSRVRSTFSPLASSPAAVTRCWWCSRFPTSLSASLLLYASSVGGEVRERLSVIACRLSLALQWRQRRPADGEAHEMDGVESGGVGSGGAGRPLASALRYEPV